LNAYIDKTNIKPGFFSKYKPVVKGALVLTKTSLSIETMHLEFSAIKAVTMNQTLTLSKNTFNDGFRPQFVFIDMVDGKKYMMDGASSMFLRNEQRLKQYAPQVIQAVQAFKQQVMVETTKKREVAKQKEQQVTMDAVRVEKLKKLVKVSTSLKITQMTQILKMNEADLYDRIVDWANEFGFTIDGESVKFDAGRKDDFINSLDQAFADWDENGATKEGKLE
jgi:hypothetical protein